MAKKKTTKRKTKKRTTKKKSTKKKETKNDKWSIPSYPFSDHKIDKKAY